MADLKEKYFGKIDSIEKAPAVLKQSTYWFYAIGAILGVVGVAGLFFAISERNYEIVLNAVILLILAFFMNRHKSRSLAILLTTYSVGAFLVTVLSRIVKAIEGGKFHICAVGSIDEGIEVLTGVPAGQRDSEGLYPTSSVNGLVEKQLREYSERLKRFTAPESKKEGAEEEE